MADTSVSIKTGVTRGPESWAYIYIALGFVVSIEGTIIQMLPITFPYNIISYLAVAAATAWGFLDNGWVQNKLVGLKTRYEMKSR